MWMLKVVIWCHDVMQVCMPNELNAYIPIVYDYEKMIMKWFYRCYAMIYMIDGNMRWLWNVNECLCNDWSNVMRCNVMGEIQWHRCTYLWKCLWSNCIYDGYAMCMFLMWYGIY